MNVENFLLIVLTLGVQFVLINWDAYSYIVFLAIMELTAKLYI